MRTLLLARPVAGHLLAGKLCRPMTSLLPKSFSGPFGLIRGRVCLERQFPISDVVGISLLLRLLCLRDEVFLVLDGEVGLVVDLPSGDGY